MVFLIVFTNLQKYLLFYCVRDEEVFSTSVEAISSSLSYTSNNSSSFGGGGEVRQGGDFMDETLMSSAAQTLVIIVDKTY